MSRTWISVEADIAQATRDLATLDRKQIPFASALAVNATARLIDTAETDAMSKVFNRPTPFTLNAFGVKPATKANPTAIVFARDVQGRYLEPSEFGGAQVPNRGNRAILTPTGVTLNSYGNLPRNKLKQLKARKDIFIGPVTTKSGAVINGVWQRVAATKAGKRGKGNQTVQNASKGRLKLLIQFTDPKDVKTRFGFHDRARILIPRTFPREFATALQKAIATAKP